MEHDLAGLEAAMERSAYLERALCDLCAYSNRSKEKLTPTQQQFLAQAINRVAILCNDELGGVV